MQRLTRRFFARPSEVVARALLGKVLVCGGRAGVVVETEAYLGPDDRASHARFGPTSRNAVMFGPGGVAYVYLIYGMYDMFNIVTGRDGEPQAVLVRAVDPSSGIAGGRNAAAGPGKLCRALGITRSRHHGVDLTASNELFLAAGSRVAPGRVARGPRIGVDYAGAWAPAPLRFWVDGHPAVSRTRS
ncbi:MAG TPA: DNA-3-methyladenine glycosylase [Candidatus Acidoferrum sp.]|nr:DNA-3-methyladenine glycosylase [Candidatus Acidoferrum sp.]